MALGFDIDAHGRLAPLSDETRRALADRAGRFLLLPATADLLVARRTPAAGGVAPRPRCILAGDLAGFPIADFIAFLHQARLSGVLTVTAAGAERSVVFQGGEVRAAHSSAAGERVGEIAVRLGLVSEAVVAQAAQGSPPIGRNLVERGAISSNDLWRCLQEQVTVVFHALLLSQEGTFQLVEEDPADRPQKPLAVSTQSLLMDGIRRIDEMSLFRARIPSGRAFLRRKEARRPITLQPVEQRLLALVDGHRTVAEVATAAHLSEFEATKILYHLAEAGYLEPVDTPTADAGEDRPAAIVRGMNDLLRRVVAAVPEPGRPGLLAAVRAFLADGASPLSPVWTRAAHGSDGALDEVALLANAAAIPAAVLGRLEPSGDRVRLLFAGLREVLFFCLFAAGERLGREGDEALAAAVKEQLASVEILVDGA